MVKQGCLFRISPFLWAVFCSLGLGGVCSLHDAWGEAPESQAAEAADEASPDQPVSDPGTNPEEAADDPAEPNTTDRDENIDDPPSDTEEDASGQADLDRAIEEKATARSLNDLEVVIELCESALRKGLDEVNGQFAKQLLSATLFQHADQLSQAIFDPQQRDERWFQFRTLALRNLQKAIDHDEKLTDAHMLIAKLEALPGGNPDTARKAIGRAIEILEPDPQQRESLSKALIIRAALAEEAEPRLADLDRAIEIFPRNLDAWRARGLHHLRAGHDEQALSDLEELLKHDTDNILAHQLVADILARMEKTDEALEHVNKAVELNPNAALPYVLRARIHIVRKEFQDALQDLDLAVAANPSDEETLLLRAQVKHELGQVDEALADLERVLKSKPGLEKAILMRSSYLSAAGRFEEAIRELQPMIIRHPDEPFYRLQVASLYIQDQRPKKAIAIYDQLLREDPQNGRALVGRADAYLSIGEHAKAVADYEVVIKLEPPELMDTIYNNFAWVLATSPIDQVRDGERAVVLATKACDLTEYKQPHILSTLAASYAEAGDFDKAIEWSEKAVELGKDHRDLEQLQGELESYRQKKPYREIQQVQDKPDPPGPDVEGLLCNPQEP